MFQNYEPDAVIPVAPGPVRMLNTQAPAVTYDNCGNILTMSWSKYALFDQKLPVARNIRVPHGAVILETSGDVPPEKAAGFVAYNTADHKCWMRSGDTWQELQDMVVTGVSDATVSWDYSDWQVKLVLEDFRRDVVKIIEGDTLQVDAEFHDEIKPGAYTLLVIVSKDNVTFNLYSIAVSITQEGLFTAAEC